MNQDQFQELVIKKFDETCYRLTRLEDKVENHIDTKIKSSARTYKFITIVMACVTTFATVWGVVK